MVSQKTLAFLFTSAIIVIWNHSSAGMSVRLTRERSGVRASLLPFCFKFFNFFKNLKLCLTHEQCCVIVMKCQAETLVCDISQVIGVWRSLVARSAGGREVAGSNPVTPILSLQRMQRYFFALFQSKKLYKKP